MCNDFESALFEIQGFPPVEHLKADKNSKIKKHKKLTKKTTETLTNEVLTLEKKMKDKYENT